jgi:Family of unknown function (DUF6441)
VGGLTGSGLKLADSLARSLQADTQAELRDIERAVTAGTKTAGQNLKTELRRQVTSAGLGQRLANSWRDRHNPNQKLDAASLICTKAPQIIRAFDEGALIRSKRGRFRYRDRRAARSPATLNAWSLLKGACSADPLEDNRNFMEESAPRLV